MKPAITIKEVSAISLLSARNWNPPPRAALISIVGSGEARVTLKKGWAHVLRLVFDDVEIPFFNLRLFSEEDADKVIDFLDKIEGKVDHVVVHCRFGQSRSPAIARYITDRYDLLNGFREHPTFNRHVFKVLFDHWKNRVEPEEGSFTDLGPAHSDHKVFSMGPIVFGRPLYPPRKRSTKE